MGGNNDLAEYRFRFAEQLARDVAFFALKSGLVDIKAAKELLSMGGSRSPNTTFQKLRR